MCNTEKEESGDIDEDVENEINLVEKIKNKSEYSLILHKLVKVFICI